MFYVDDKAYPISKIIDEKPTGQVFDMILDRVKHYQSLPEKKFPIQFKWREGIVKFNKAGASSRGGMVKEGKKGLFVRFGNPVSTSDGAVTVRIAESSSEKKDGTKIYKPRGEWFKGSWFFHRDEIEKIVYLELFSPEVKSGKILIDMPEKDAEKLADKRSLAADLNFYIYGSDSPLNSDVNDLIRLAQAWNIPDTGDKTMAQLKNELFTSVELGEKRKDKEKDYAAFMSEVKGLSKKTKMLILVRKLQDNNLVRFDGGLNTWMAYNGKEQPERKLLEISANDVARKESALAQYILRDLDLQDVMKRNLYHVLVAKGKMNITDLPLEEQQLYFPTESIKDQDSEEKDPDVKTGEEEGSGLTPEQDKRVAELADWDMKELRKEAKEYSINTFAMNKEKIATEIVKATS